MTDVLTLTMNPALDVLTTIDQVQGTHKMRCGAVIKHPGGGGVNVARVLHRLGTSCLAVYPAGGVTGERHHHMLHAEHVRSHVVPIAEETRESFSVHELSSGHDFRFVLPGPALRQAEYEACFDFVASHLPRKFLVVSGGLAPQVPNDFYARLAQLAQAHQLPFVLDANGPALTEALRVGVTVFKPSLRELRELTGLPLQHESDYTAAARALIRSGQSQVVALSLGEEGALLVSAQQSWRAQSLKVPVQTTIGAGDSFVGGLVGSLCRGNEMAHAFRYAMAASAAALLAPGTPLCRAEDVQRLLPDVVIQAV